VNPEKPAGESFRSVDAASFRSKLKLAKEEGVMIYCGMVCRAHRKDLFKDTGGTEDQ